MHPDKRRIRRAGALLTLLVSYAREAHAESSRNACRYLERQQVHGAPRLPPSAPLDARRYAETGVPATKPLCPARIRTPHEHAASSSSMMYLVAWPRLIAAASPKQPACASALCTHICFTRPASPIPQASLPLPPEPRPAGAPRVDVCTAPLWQMQWTSPLQQSLRTGYAPLHSTHASATPCRAVSPGAPHLTTLAPMHHVAEAQHQIMHASHTCITHASSRMPRAPHPIRTPLAKLNPCRQPGP